MCRAKYGSRPGFTFILQGTFYPYEEDTAGSASIASIAAPITANATQANGIGYSYVQLDYAYVGSHYRENQQDGGILSGSRQFDDNFHVFGSYSDFSAQHYSLSNKPWTLGMGFANAIGSKVDWVSRLAYSHDGVHANLCGNFDCTTTYRAHANANTYFVTTGVMGRVTDSLTLNAYLGYHDGDHDVQGFYADFGAIYSFSPVWALHGGLTVNNNSSQTYSVGVRASF